MLRGLEIPTLGGSFLVPGLQSLGTRRPEPRTEAFFKDWKNHHRQKGRTGSLFEALEGRWGGMGRGWGLGVSVKGERSFSQAELSYGGLGSPGRRKNELKYSGRDSSPGWGTGLCPRVPLTHSSQMLGFSGCHALPKDGHDLQVAQHLWGSFASLAVCPVARLTLAFSPPESAGLLGAVAHPGRTPGAQGPESYWPQDASAHRHRSLLWP